LLFLIGIVAVMFYATAISDTVGLIQNPVLPRNEAIVVFMLTIATLISITCKIDTGEVLNASTFKSGMSACVCVLGVAWLGDTFVKAHISDIQTVAGDLLHNYPWLLAVVLFFAATLLFPGRDHQGADARRADAGREPADRHRLICRRLRPVRSADLPHPAGGGRNG
jgi:anaerobic C4-dicarboxylate transporter DcuA